MWDVSTMGSATAGLVVQGTIRYWNEQSKERKPVPTISCYPDFPGWWTIRLNMRLNKTPSADFGHSVLSKQKALIKVLIISY